MRAAKLRLLRVLVAKLVADAVEQPDVALLWVLLERGDECPGHGACGLAGDLGVLSVGELDVSRFSSYSMDARLDCNLGPSNASDAIVPTQLIVPPPRSSRAGLFKAEGLRVITLYTIITS